MLKHSPDFPPQILYSLAILCMRQIRLESNTITLNRPAANRFQTVETSQQRRLPTARCTHDTQLSLRRYIEADPLEDLATAEPLAQIRDADHASASSSTRSVARSRRRLSSSRARWAIGKLIAR